MSDEITVDFVGGPDMTLPGWAKPTDLINGESLAGWQRTRLGSYRYNFTSRDMPIGEDRWDDGPGVQPSDDRKPGIRVEA